LLPLDGVTIRWFNFRLVSYYQIVLSIRECDILCLLKGYYYRSMAFHLMENYFDKTAISSGYHIFPCTDTITGAWLINWWIMILTKYIICCLLMVPSHWYYCRKTGIHLMENYCNAKWSFWKNDLNLGGKIWPMALCVFHFNT